MIRRDGRINLRKPTRIAEGMKKQVPFATIIFRFRQPRNQLLRHLCDPFLEPPPQINPEHLSHRNNESYCVNSSRIIQIHVPPQMLSLRSKPTQQHHRRGRTTIPYTSATNAPLGSSIPLQNLLFGIELERRRGGVGRLRER